MAKSKVLLIKPIKKLGNEGDIVSVALGFSRNYLIPQKKAIPITQANKKSIDALVKVKQLRLAKELQDSEDLANKIKKLNFAIVVKTGENGKMFGSITINMIMEKLLINNININKKSIIFPNAIRELGQHKVIVKLNHDIKVDLEFEVLSENPIAS